MTNPYPPTIALATLGCKVNQAETEAITRRFASAGFLVRSFDALADVYVLNTCTVTHVADRKARHLLRQARRRNPNALLVATGCYATTDPEAIRAIPGVDLVVPNEQKQDLPALVGARLDCARAAADASSPGSQRTGPAVRTRAFVKVQDGCDNFCAYCIVPFARGRPRSVAPDQVVAQVQALVSAGYQEVVLTGVHLGLYGRDLPTHACPLTLTSLVRRILNETQVRRLRLSSIEPQDFAADLLGLWADGRLCRHLHLPLQAGADATLQRVGRRYTVATFADLVARCRTSVPGLAVTTDMIVGLPGETEVEFRESYDFARAMGFARIHVFPYSPRQGTRAASMPNQVPEPTKRARSQALMHLSEESGRSFTQSFLGQVLEVLWEERLPPAAEDAAPRWAGLTDNYIRVTAENPEDMGNRITPVRLVGLRKDGALGQMEATWTNRPGYLTSCASGQG